MSEIMPDQSSQERLRKRRHLIVRPLAALAIIGTLAGCGVVAERHITGADRHTPSSGAYSRSANPEFYADVAALRGQTTDTGLRNRLDRLLEQPVAEWLPADPDAAASDITEALARTKKDGTVPVFVSYAIPDRDLGGQSAGGLDYAGYKDYMSSVSKAIGTAPAVMVVEPDALAHLPDLNDDQRRERTTLLGSALDTLYQNPKTAVYLDAGNSDWRTADETAGYLRDVASHAKHGIPGISLNVSNFQSEAATRTYAAAIEKAYGKPLYTLIDDSRNGNAASMKKGDWCNPANQLLGTADTTYDSHAKIETFYIKTPGESDGQCGVSTMPAGTFDNTLLIDQLTK